MQNGFSFCSPALQRSVGKHRQLESEQLALARSAMAGSSVGVNADHGGHLAPAVSKSSPRCGLNEHQLPPHVVPIGQQPTKQTAGGSKAKCCEHPCTAAEVSDAVQTPLEKAKTSLRQALRAQETAKKDVVALLQSKSAVDVALCFAFLRSLTSEAVAALLNRANDSVDALASGALLRKAFGFKDEQIRAVLMSPLMQITLLGNPDVVVRLIGAYGPFLDLSLQGSILLNGGPLSSKPVDLLAVAVVSGSVQLLEVLLRQGCLLPDLAIRAAVSLDKIDELITIFRLLPNLGSDNKVFGPANTPSSLTLQDVLLDVVRFSKHPNSLTLLQLLVERGGTVTQAVMHAALFGAADNIVRWCVGVIDPTSLGALFLQLLNGYAAQHLPQIEKLLQHTNCYTAKFNDDRTALMATAAAADKLPFLRAILGNISDVDFVNERHPISGRTALHFAAECRCLDAVEALLEAQANPAATDAAGKTPFDLAAEAISVRSMQEDLQFICKLQRLCLKFAANAAVRK